MSYLLTGMDLNKAILLAIGTICSALGLFAPFSRKYRDASGWLRSVWFVGSIFLLTWSILELVLLSHEKGGHSDLSWARFLIIDHWKSDIGGMGAGILLALVTSPEFRKRSLRSSQTSNKELQATPKGSDADF